MIANETTIYQRLKFIVFSVSCTYTKQIHLKPMSDSTNPITSLAIHIFLHNTPYTYTIHYSPFSVPILITHTRFMRTYTPFNSHMHFLDGSDGVDWCVDLLKCVSKNCVIFYEICCVIWVYIYN